MDLDKALKSAEEGEWKEMETEDDPQPQFKIKTLKPYRISEIRRKCMKKKSLQYPDGLDDEMLNKLILRECLVDWKELTKDGEEYPYSETHADFINDNWMAFRQWWGQMFKSMLQNGQAEEDEDLGN